MYGKCWILRNGNVCEEIVMGQWFWGVVHVFSCINHQLWGLENSSKHHDFCWDVHWSFQNVPMFLHIYWNDHGQLERPVVTSRFLYGKNVQIAPKSNGLSNPLLTKKIAIWRVYRYSTHFQTHPWNTGGWVSKTPQAHGPMDTEDARHDDRPRATGPWCGSTFAYLKMFKKLDDELLKISQNWISFRETKEIWITIISHW